MNKRVSAACVVCCLGILLAAAANARPWIDMGYKDDTAFDQPAVAFELFEQVGGNKGVSLGPSDGGFFFVANQFILDTGATSVIAMNDALGDLESHGYEVQGSVLEQGVAGFSFLDVSETYYMEVTDSSGAKHAVPSIRIMSGDFPELFTVNGIVGMPGMVGKVVTLDTSVWGDIGPIEDIEDLLNLVPMDVRLSNSLPAGDGHRYSVPIRAQNFPVEVVEGQPPSASPIPFVEMSVGFGSQNATGSFILDTGASISFISPAMAIAIGLDSNNDGVLNASDEQSDGTLPIGGIGGTIEAPVFYIDRMAVTTEQGVDLVWELEQATTVLVLDIHPDIDGVLGSDLLTSGWFVFAEEELDIDTSVGPLQQVHFDFRNFFNDGDIGKIYFDLTPSFDVVQPGGLAGDYNGDGTVNAADYSLWRDTLGTSGSGLAADGNGNGSVDAEDYNIWKNNFGQSLAPGGGSGASAVPEPAGMLLLFVALFAIAPARSASSLRCGASSCR